MEEQQTVTVPDGWKLVPTKMNAAMINAWSGGLTVSSDENAYRTSFQNAWHRVLAAAPQPPMPEVNGLTEAQLLARVAAVICEETCGLTSECKSREAASALLKNGYLATTPPADEWTKVVARLTQERDEAREENERLRQRLNHYIKATIDKNSDLISAEVRMKMLEEENERLQAIVTQQQKDWMD